tara:strand:- start:93 stop:1097 length:1005 start_codon:yes stop_codon:yes gene_type:complete
MDHKRRNFIQTTIASSLGIPLIGPNLISDSLLKDQKIKISLQCYSFASSFFTKKMNIIDFPKIVREDFNIEAAEYWNRPMVEKRRDSNFIREFNKRTNDYGLKNTFMLVDLINFQTGESKSLCSRDKIERNIAIEEHKEWIEFSKAIGCKGIRVNLWSDNMTSSEVKSISQDSLGELLEFSNKINMSIVIENHGGYTSDAKWLIDLIKSINHPKLGTLPDFGTRNFCIKTAPKTESGIFGSECVDQYDKYKGVKEMLPYAKGISAKSHTFNNDGEEMSTDYKKMINLIKASGFNDYIAIEYEGAIMALYGKGNSKFLSSHEGILATKKLIEKYI